VPHTDSSISFVWFSGFVLHWSFISTLVVSNHEPHFKRIEASRLSGFAALCCATPATGFVLVVSYTPD
jgi:hypothetical protein